jgi:hypothetical protein
MRLHKRSPSGDSDADSIANYGELKEVDQRQQADDEILAMEDLASRVIPFAEYAVTCAEPSSL